MNRLLQGDVGASKTSWPCCGAGRHGERAAGRLHGADQLAGNTSSACESCSRRHGSGELITRPWPDWPRLRARRRRHPGRQHAHLVQGTVTFRSLGLAIIDEHRFGVVQRATCETRLMPDVLVAARRRFSHAGADVW